MHNPMNRNPEENRPLDPFAAAEAPVQSTETTYPVEADGEIHELTLDELIATIHSHPTVTETMREAALQAEGRAIHTANK